MKDPYPLTHFLGTPITLQGWAWLPAAQLAGWGIFAWLEKRQHPERPLDKRLSLAGIKMTVFLGSEWLHNLAHAAAARLVGKPMDSLKVLLGMPLCVYADPDDPNVTPRQHIARALGGPVFNAALMLAARGLRQLTKPQTPAREVADLAVGMNTFLSTVSFLPVPEFDGGPILKYSLVERGQTLQEAKETVRKVNWFSGTVLVGVAAVLLKKRNWLWGGLAAQLGAVSLIIAAGGLKEKDWTRVRDKI